MIKEIYYFFRYGPSVHKRKDALGIVEFMKVLSQEMDAAGFADLRTRLLGDLEGDILEIGAGTGATFGYYMPTARVTAIEPDDDFRVAAEDAARHAKATIHVMSGAGEDLQFQDASFDVITASLVMCSVTSLSETFEEFKRVLRPGGKIRLLEHVRSKHWVAGPAMDLLNPVWLKLNNVGCNWNRNTVEEVKAAGFTIQSVDGHKIYSTSAPAAFPLRLIKAEWLG